MTRLLILAAVGLLATIPSESVMLQEKPESASLTAVTVDLRGGKGSQVYRNIWHDAFDQELALRKKFSEVTKRPPILTTDVFVVAFNVNAPKGKIVLAATGTPANSCQSYTNLGLSPSLMTCAMRVALVQADETKIIYSSDAFAFSIGVNEKGEFDNANPETRTSVTFDPVNKVLRTHPSEAGPHIEGFNPVADDTEIHLKY